MLNNWNMNHLFYSIKILSHSEYALKILMENTFETSMGHDLISGLWSHDFGENGQLSFFLGPPTWD